MVRYRRKKTNINERDWRGKCVFQMYFKFVAEPVSTDLTRKRQKRCPNCSHLICGPKKKAGR